jgi:hypothetical protein
VRRRRLLGKRWFDCDHSRVLLADRKLEVTRGREEMSVAETRAEQFADGDDRIPKVVVLHGLPRLVMELKRDATSAFGLDETGRDFLQMLFRAFIITQRKLYK